MKNRIKNILKNIALISLAMFQFFGCKQIEDLKDSEKVAYITINNSLARSAMPELSIEKMTNFVLKGTFSGEEEQELGTWDNAESLKTAKVLIKPGLWDFKLISQQGGVFFSATIEKKQIEVALNNLEFNLSVSSMDLQNGTGSISIDFKKILPYSYGSKYVCIYIYDLEGKKIKRLSTFRRISCIDDYCDYFSGENDVYYYKSVKYNIPAGTYFIDFKFYGSDNYDYSPDYVSLVGTFRELVTVTADCTSLLTVENLDLSKMYGIIYDLNGGSWVSKYYPQSLYTPNASKELPTSAKIYKTGYSFAGWYTDESFSGEPVTEIPIGSTGYKKFYAKWEPSTVRYRVVHCLQGVSNPKEYCSFNISDDYKSGKTEDYTVAVPREYSGFTAQQVEQKQIAPDGSTVVNIYYNRNDVTVTLKLNGGNINGRTEDFVISGRYLDTYTADDFYKDFGIKYDVPQKDGVYFESYNTDSDFLKKTSEFELIFPASDAVCTAEYSLLDYIFKVFKEKKLVTPNFYHNNAYNAYTEIEPFYIGETEVTCEIWYKVQQWAINTYPKKYNNSEKNIKFNTIIEEPSADSKYKPICDISYNDACLWCNAASEMCGLETYYEIEPYKDSFFASTPFNNDNTGYRLPRDSSEWVYAAKGGEYMPSDYYGTYDYTEYKWYKFDSDNKYYYYFNYERVKKRYFWEDTYAGTSSKDNLSEYAVLSGIESVKSKKSNSVGLYDMSGNATEFTADQYLKADKIMTKFIGDDNRDKKWQNTGFRLARSVIE